MDLAVNHLVQLGHTEIGLAVGPERFMPVIRKVAGLPSRDARAPRHRAGRQDRLITHTVFSLEGGAAAAGATHLAGGARR